MATKTTDTTDNSAGCSPCTPEAHQRSVFETKGKNMSIKVKLDEAEQGIERIRAGLKKIDEAMPELFSEMLNDGYLEHEVRSTARHGVFLRLYRARPGAQFVVQQIFNAGEHDKRKKAAGREWRKILIKTADRAKAVAVFNNKMEEIEREVKGQA